MPFGFNRSKFSKYLAAQQKQQKPKKEPAGPDFAKAQEDRIRRQFSAQRRKLGAQEDRAKEQSKMDLDRYSAASGVQTGAIAKLKGQQQAELEKGFGEVEAGLTGAEEGTVLQAREAERQRQFAGGEAEKQRQMQREMFNKQMDLAFKEFDASKLSQMINATIALKKGGVGSEEWQEKFLDNQFGGLFDFEGSGRTDFARWEKEQQQRQWEEVLKNRGER